jgi:hypothetical protein
MHSSVYHPLPLRVLDASHRAYIPQFVQREFLIGVKAYKVRQIDWEILQHE